MDALSTSDDSPQIFILWLMNEYVIDALKFDTVTRKFQLI
jgi:hypothetical protein